MSLAISQNALSTAAEMVVAAGRSKRKISIKNTDAAILVYIGTSAGVTAANGWVLGPAAVLEMDEHLGELWAIAASGTPSIAIIEQTF